MKVKLILEARFARTWVHYDHELVNLETGKMCGYMKSKSNWGYSDPPYPSFKATCALSYIISPDKKKWRKFHQDWDGEVKVDQFNKRQTIASIDWHGRTIDITNITITEVVVRNPVYIDPKTSTVWRYRKIEKDIYSKRAWLFKKMPNPEITPIWVMDDISFFLSKKEMCETAFLSGQLLKKLCSWREDPRKFLYEKPKKDKQCIIKSVTRQLKKLIKTVKPISEQTKKFFKLAGAFKHLKTQQKYAN